MRRLLALAVVLAAFFASAGIAQAGYLHEWYAYGATRDWDAAVWPGTVVSAHCTRSPAPYSAISVSCYETRVSGPYWCNFSGGWTGQDYYVTGIQSWTCNFASGSAYRAY